MHNLSLHYCTDGTSLETRAATVVVSSEHWERWRAKRKLVSGFKHRGTSAGIRRYHPRTTFEIVCAKSCNLGRKMVRIAVHNAFLNTNNGNAFSRRSGSFSTVHGNGVNSTRFPGPHNSHPKRNWNYGTHDSVKYYRINEFQTTAGFQQNLSAFVKQI